MKRTDDHLVRGRNSAGDMRGHTPARVIIIGHDISIGSRPIASSVLELLVTFILPIHRSLPRADRQSHQRPSPLPYWKEWFPKHSPWTVEQWRCMHSSGITTIRKPLATHPALTGILTSLLEDSKSKLIHPVVVLMKLSGKVSVTFRDGEGMT